MGKNTKLNLTELLSFSEGSSLRDKGICNAKQSSSSQKRTVTRRGLGGLKSSPHPPARPGVPGGTDLPGRRGVPGNLWLARALKSYDSLSGQLGTRCPGNTRPFSALQGQTLLGSACQVCRMGLLWAVCVQGPKRGLKEQTPLPHPPPGIHLVTCRWVHRTLPASLRPRSPRSLSPALCKPAPDTHNLQDSSGPQGALPHPPSG